MFRSMVLSSTRRTDQQLGTGSQKNASSDSPTRRLARRASAKSSARLKARAMLLRSAINQRPADGFSLAGQFARCEGFDGSWRDAQQLVTRPAGQDMQMHVGDLLACSCAV